MYKINQEQFAALPDELKALYVKLPNPSSEEVRECFPESTSGARKAGFTNKDTGYEASSYEMRVHWDKDVPSEKGNASRFFKSIIYQAKASKSNRGDGNNHATVKPTALMEYLITMVSREGATILDPFAGSGTTGVACKNTNRNYILIEKEPEYIEIIKKRLEE